MSRASQVSPWREVLESALRLSARLPWLDPKTHGFLQPLRLFHGPTEGRGRSASILIDRLGSWVWITDRTESEVPLSAFELQEIAQVLLPRGILGGVILDRPKSQLPSESRLAFGHLPEEPFVVVEEHPSGGGSDAVAIRMQIRLLGERHPGFFLDHSPLRNQLLKTVRGRRVLNTFSYTGSLSVAAGLGGAADVTTLDLSRKTLELAKVNWDLNLQAQIPHAIVADDFFEFAARQTKKQRSWDLIILDPPSFSRSKNGTFSTQKDLVRLHESAIRLLSPRGLLVSSINSANVSARNFESQVTEAARKLGRELHVIDRIRLPEWIPVAAGQEPYLKGVIAEVT